MPKESIESALEEEENRRLSPNAAISVVEGSGPAPEITSNI